MKRGKEEEDENGHGSLAMSLLFWPSFFCSHPI